MFRFLALQVLNGTYETCAGRPPSIVYIGLLCALNTFSQGFKYHLDCSLSTLSGHESKFTVSAAITFFKVSAHLIISYGDIIGRLFEDLALGTWINWLANQIRLKARVDGLREHANDDGSLYLALSLDNFAEATWWYFLQCLDLPTVGEGIIKEGKNHCCLVDHVLTVRSQSSKFSQSTKTWHISVCLCFEVPPKKLEIVHIFQSLVMNLNSQRAVLCNGGRLVETSIFFI